MQPLRSQIFQIILYGAGVTSIAAVVYMAGPMIDIGGYRPLESYIVRDIVIAILVSAAAGMGGVKFWKRRKSGEALAEAVGADKEPQNDEPLLKDRMKDALATLKTASGGKGDFLYDLPWYIIIGPPGAGKTTALVNSGLKFPLSRGATPAAVSGVGGTRYCDWWFTEDAVLIDTAGRYTTQDSDEKSDKKSWFAFLDLLKKTRPRQPINGVMIAISVGDIITAGPAELEAHASAIRARLVELHDKLKVDFPVYAVFTKTDLIAGFSEFFGILGDKSRKQVWGATFQTSDKTKNMVGDVPTEFDHLIARLNEFTTDRLQEEPTPSTRVALYGFPAQMATLRKPIFNFLNQIFEPTRYHANATLRGFYFTSGTQQGTPIDQLIGALSKTFGAEQVQGAAYSGQGKSFFLTDLIGKLIIGESGWVSFDSKALRRQRILRAAAYTLLFLVSAGTATAFWTSYTRNRDLIDRTDVAAAEYASVAGPLANETVIADRDLTKVVPLLFRLRYMPVGYNVREDAAPLAEGFGLSQRGRLLASSESSYRIGLERLLRPRLIFRLEEQFEQRRTDPGFLYEALKVYKMLGGQRVPDKELILAWMRRDWAEALYPGSANTEGRKALEEHVTAMLDMQGNPLVGVNGALIEDAETTLSRLDISQRAYELLKSQARSSGTPDWIPARVAGQDFDLLFDFTQGDTLDSVRVPGFYTWLGFHRDFIDKLAGISDRLKAEQWVLGEAGRQTAVAEQYDRLPTDLMARYSKDYIDIWQKTLAKLKIKRLTADKPKYIGLTAAVAPTSPLKKLIVSIRNETAVTRERPDLKAFLEQEAAKNSKDGKPAVPAAAPSLAPQGAGGAPGADIEEAFKPYATMVDGDAGRTPMDTMLSNLSDIRQSLLAATNPALAPQANAQLSTQVPGLRSSSNLLPGPFATMMQSAANEFDGDATNAKRTEINRILNETVTAQCQQIIGNRYPFSKSDRDVPIGEFGRLFGHSGVIDNFFKTQIQTFVDTSKPDWIWRQDTAMGRAMGQSGAIKDFQRAAQIRDTFFPGGGQSPSVSLIVTPPPLPFAPPANAFGQAAPPPNSGSAFGFGQPSPQNAAPPGTQPRLTPQQLADQQQQAFAQQQQRTAAAGTTQYRFDINGTPVISQAGPAQPVPVLWQGGPGRTAIIVQGDLPGQQPALVEKPGPWGLFKMVDSGSAVQRGDRMVLNYVIGGKELQYIIQPNSSRNPFTMPALREFRCPTGL